MGHQALLDRSAFVSIEGCQLDLSELWNWRDFDQKRRRAIYQSFASAAPFPHLVVDGLFSDELLSLIVGEFDQLTAADWRHARCENESTHRSPFGLKLGPAAELYFSKIYSKDFIRFLSDVTGIETLIPDADLIGGGLHESHNGDWFNVHVDFAKHPRTLLDNELVILTYLNKDWPEEYGGSLELWDANTGECVKTIVPVFGRTVILKHGKTSLHGHTKPICAPDGRVRRSLAAYYYGHHDAPAVIDEEELTSAFFRPRRSTVTKIKEVVRMASPPVFVTMAKSVRRKLAGSTDWTSVRPR
jgi:hypothetical protein